jgi:prepilin-type processing-associated H-X9-DG protein
VAGAALAEAAKTTGAGLALLKFMIMTKTQIAAATVAAGLTAAIVIQSRENSRLQQENVAFRQEAAQQETMRAENERSAAAPAPAVGTALNQSQLRELLRLRAEVGDLKQQLSKVKTFAPTKVDRVESPRESRSEEAVPEQQKIAMAKMNYTKQWMLAFLMYANDHQQACPTNFDQATDYWPKDETETNLTTNQFQVLYRGSFNEITNPAETIVLGEADPVEGPDGGWLKTYGFADGHVEIHKAPDGNFAPWESQHIQAQGPEGQ